MCTYTYRQVTTSANLKGLLWSAPKVLNAKSGLKIPDNALQCFGTAPVPAQYGA